MHVVRRLLYLLCEADSLQAEFALSGRASALFVWVWARMGSVQPDDTDGDEVAAAACAACARRGTQRPELEGTNARIATPTGRSQCTDTHRAARLVQRHGFIVLAQAQFHYLGCLNTIGVVTLLSTSGANQSTATRTL